MVMIKVPATAGNLGPGFDTLGMALIEMNNYIAIKEIERGLEIDVSGEDEDKIPTDESNLAYRAAIKVFERVDYFPAGLRIELQNDIPVSRGLGSSAATIVGSMVAANYLSGNQLNNDQLMIMASAMEEHPDNVSAAFLGGIVISSKFEDSIICRKINPPTSLTTVAAIPDFEVCSKDARKVLPSNIPLEDAVYNMRNTGLLIYAMIENDLDLLTQVLDDKFHQPYRMSLVPGMQDVIKAAKDNDALGAVLSGAGPTIIAFCTANCQEKIAQGMKEAFLKAGIKCRTRYLNINPKGMEILKRGGEKK